MQAGTFWYHSHYGNEQEMLPITLNLISNLFPGTQYCDGMRGALVVYDPEDPHKALYDGKAH